MENSNSKSQYNIAATAATGDKPTALDKASVKPGENKENTSLKSHSGEASPRLSKTQLRKQVSLTEARRVCSLLAESNVAGVQRMVEIFGAAWVSQKAQEALQFYQEAESRGPVAYSLPNTPVATGKSQPRTRGGVFFYLVREHCASLGLDWEGLKIASSLWFEEGRAKREAASASGGPMKGTINRGTSTSEEADYSSSTGGVKPAKEKNVASATSQTANNRFSGNKIEKETQSKSSSSEVSSGSVKSSNASTKPGRIKATLSGTLTGSPKFNPNGREGLVELPFRVEMNQALPKGLPNLGESRVLVWCTTKQYEKISSIIKITSETRFLIEGEPVPAVSADLSPFMRLICTRFSTLEMEQARREAPADQNQTNQ